KAGRWIVSAGAAEAIVKRGSDGQAFNRSVQAASRIEAGCVLAVARQTINDTGIPGRAFQKTPAIRRGDRDGGQVGLLGLRSVYSCACGVHAPSTRIDAGIPRIGDACGDAHGVTGLVTGEQAGVLGRLQLPAERTAVVRVQVALEGFVADDGCEGTDLEVDAVPSWNAQR